MQIFSAGDYLYRIRRFVRSHLFDRLAQDDYEVALPIPDCSIIDTEDAHLYYPIFKSEIDINKEIDWHLDLSTGKRFPARFAYDIDIRSGFFGSVKYVWEVNRMQFLLHLAFVYRGCGDLKWLVLFCHYIATWREDNPYMEGVNWYSNVEVNLRLICWYFCWQVLNVDDLRKHNSAIDEFIGDAWMQMICEHAEYSYVHPSLHFSANNHRVAELVGLFVAAAGWKIPHKKSRLAYAKKGLEKEILLQNSPEGVNREEAAEYIQYVNELFLIAAIVGKRVESEFSKAYDERLRAMANYMNAIVDSQYNYPMYGDGDDRYVLRPDAGGHFNNFKSLLVSFATYFGDASFKREGLAWDEKNSILFGEEGKKIFESLPCTPLRDGNRFFAQSGHFVFRKLEQDHETYMHFDAAPLGYLSIAAHGHADALSFILHVDGHPVIVDPGTFSYYMDKKLRNYFVSTFAHNTICVNGKNQAEQIGPTMWQNHYKVNVIACDETAGEVTASHDGYATEGVIHTRQVRYDRERDEFTITDSLLCAKNVVLEVPFHLHPDASVELRGTTAEISVPGSRRVVLELDAKLSYVIRDDGWFSEHFDDKVQTKFLYAKTECSGNIEFVTKVKILSE